MFKRLPTVSRAGQWTKCPASFKAQLKYPPLDDSLNESALEGLSCHLMLEELQKGITPVEGELCTKYNVVRTVEMIEAVYQCFEATPDDAILEGKITLDHIHEGWYGYCDAYFLRDNELNVFDYKFGRSYVEVEGNLQLIAYALGISHLKALDDEMVVNLHILQPRGYFTDKSPHRTWSTTVGDLRSEYEELFYNALEEALGDDPTARSGEQCKYCSARAYCDTFKKSTNNCIDVVQSLTLVEPTNEQIGVELTLIEKAIEHLNNAKNALEEQALFKLKNGEPVQGWSIDTVNGRRRWKKDVHDTIVNIGTLYGVGVTKETLLTPNQIMKKGIDKSVIDEYIETPSSVKLVKFDADGIADLFK